MIREGRTMRASATMALASAVVLLGGYSTATLAADNGLNDRKLDTSSGLTPDMNDPAIAGDPDYGVCRGTDPKCYHNWVHDRQNRVLIYSRTAGPRHANIQPALAAGLNPPLSPTGNVAQRAIRDWMAEVGVQVNWTEDVNTLAGQLGPGSSYKAVIFLSPTRDTLWKHGALSATAAVNTTTNAHLDAGKTALRQFMRSGGGFVGIHNAFGTEYNWPYYEGLLGNANYYNHGDNQDGDVVVVAQDPSTAGLPPRWPFRDEWYNLRPFPTKVKFLLTVDAQKQGFELSGDHPGHGKFHPVAWCQYYDGGRVWVTTLGHDPQFAQGAGFPGGAEFKKLIVQGILSAMGNTDFCTEDHRQR
ncbi:MAG TPA: ThuA domain-containing protein [Burkholderiales bacterium]|nr:ThuA domain-containing protein [Burkholderiales bacterium]